MADTNNLPAFFADDQFGETDMAGLTSPDDIFSILEALEGQFSPLTSPLDEAIFVPKENQESSVATTITRLVSQKSTSSSALQEYCEPEPEPEIETEPEHEPEPKPELPSSPISKRQKLSDQETAVNSDEQQKISHITVERNRRKQMNEHLTVLRTIMPCFYVKRGDQASIVGGVVDYITELQQVLQSLEAKKQRKVYSDTVLSPRVLSSPRSSQTLSPRKSPLSPMPNLPISPRTPQPQLPTSPYKPGKLQQAPAGYNLSPSKATAPSLEPSPTSSSTTSSVNDSINELVANSKSDIADVEVKFSGPNLILKTLSPRIPGQAMKIISKLEKLSLEILHADISAIDEATMVNSFTIKIGIGCQLSAEELAQQIQQTFC